jgi:hypothetical protein
MAKKAVAPSFGQELGLMYKRWTLDCVIEIADAVAWILVLGWGCTNKLPMISRLS